ncbi:hypothetical protein D9M68_624470 [compost metagenome]
MLASQRLASGVLHTTGGGVRARRNRSEHGDIAGTRAAQPVGIAVAEVGGQRPVAHGDAGALGEQPFDVLEAILDAGLDRGFERWRQAGRVEGLAGLQAEALEAGEGLDFLVAVGLFGEARVVEDQADPLQEFRAAQAAGFDDLLHARIGRVVGFAGHHVFRLDVLLAGGEPLAQGHHRDVVHDLVDRLQLLRRVVGQRDARHRGGKVGRRLDDFRADEVVGNLAAPVRPDEQPAYRPRGVELAADHVPPARIVIHHLDAPVALVGCRHGDHHRLLAQVQRRHAVQGGGVGHGGEARQRLGRCARPLEAVHTDETRALLVLRVDIAQVVDRHRVHAPEEGFMGDGARLLGRDASRRIAGRCHADVGQRGGCGEGNADLAGDFHGRTLVLIGRVCGALTGCRAGQDCIHPWRTAPGIA